jgi:hypothetical protein
LGRLLNEFDNNEIDDLRLKLGWRQDELWSDGATLDERARALVEACTRHGSLGSLLRLVELSRPSS